MYVVYEAPNYAIAHIWYLVFSSIVFIIIVIGWKELNIIKKIGSVSVLAVFSFQYIVSAVTAVGIMNAIENKCNTQHCKVWSGEISDFKSYKDSRKYSTDEFKINGVPFFVRELGDKYNYNVTADKGGVINERYKYYKFYIYKDYIIKIYRGNDSAIK